MFSTAGTDNKYTHGLSILASFSRDTLDVSRGCHLAHGDYPRATGTISSRKGVYCLGRSKDSRG